MPDEEGICNSLSRLDRLFLLLENGSTPLVRKSAAEQLGHVQKLYPHEFSNLLSKVRCRFFFFFRKVVAECLHSTQIYRKFYNPSAYGLWQLITVDYREIL